MIDYKEFLHSCIKRHKGMFRKILVITLKVIITSVLIYSAFVILFSDSPQTHLIFLVY